MDTPFNELSKEVQDIILYGTNGHEVKVHYKGQRGEGTYDVAFEGLVPNVNRRYRETSNDGMKQEYEAFMTVVTCASCNGQRLKPESLAVTVGGKNITDVTNK